MAYVAFVVTPAILKKVVKSTANQINCLAKKRRSGPENVSVSDREQYYNTVDSLCICSD